MAVSPMQAGQRRMLVGANVILQIALVTAAVIGLIAASPMFSRQFDLTRSATNSLSPRTLKMLGNLPQDVRITAVYTVISDLTNEKEQRERVRDLLELYDRAGGARVSSFVIDPYKERERVQELLKRLQNLPAFRDEGQAHRAALDEFETLAAELATQLTSDAQGMEERAAANPGLKERSRYELVMNTLREMAAAITQLRETIAEERKGDVPRYGVLLENVRSELGRSQTNLKGLRQWLATEGPAISAATDDTKQFFGQVASRFEGLNARVDGLLSKVKDLRATKLEETVDALKKWERNRPPILVETADDARVVAYEDVWPPPRDPNAGVERQFAGEQAISSAILHLVEKEKTAVVFVHYGPPALLTPDMQLMMQTGQFQEAPLQELAQTLDKANFITREWDLATVKTAPAVEGAARTIYVVFPPPPTPQPNPTRPTPAGVTDVERTAVAEAVAQSGMSIFLTPMDMPEYAFGDYLISTWGIDPQHTLSIVRFGPLGEPGAETRFAMVSTLLDTSLLRFTDHEIGRPLQSLPLGFLNAAPLRPVSGSRKPAGVRVTPVLETVRSDTLWGVQSMAELQREQRRQRGLKQGPADSLSQLTEDRRQYVFDAPAEIDALQKAIEAKKPPSGTGLPEEEYWWAAFDMQMLDLALEKKEPQGRIAGQLSTTKKRLESLAQKHADHPDVKKWQQRVEEELKKPAGESGNTFLSPAVPWEDPSYAGLWVNLHYARSLAGASEWEKASAALGNARDAHRQLMRLRPPFVVGLAAETEDKKRTVVFSSMSFILDSVANYAQPVMIGGRIQMLQMFPGNTELFLNSLHWVSGDAERIAVGPRGDDVPRLTGLKPGFWTNFWKVFLIGVWPALILLTGAGVYLMRRA